MSCRYSSKSEFLMRRDTFWPWRKMVFIYWSQSMGSRETSFSARLLKQASSSLMKRWDCDSSWVFSLHAECFVFAVIRTFVCLSSCMSVTQWYYIKTMQARIMMCFSLWIGQIHYIGLKGLTPIISLDKKFKLMLTRRAKAYSSSCSQTVSLSPAISSQFILGVCAATKDRKNQ